MGEQVGWAVSAAGLGFVYAALPGAVNAEALRRGVAGGFRRYLLVHAGAIFGAGFWAVVALTGASFLARYDGVTIALGLLGAAVLLLLTVTAVRGFIAGGLPAATEPHSGADIRVGLMLGVANPAGLPFWTGLAGDVAISGDGTLETDRAVVFVVGVLLGSLLWGVAISGLIAWGRRFLTAGFFRAVNAVCAVAFGYFALRMLWTAVSEIID
jgi:threonine/homoserine/homoserine lactone efflux protein